MGTNGCNIILPWTMVEPKPRFFEFKISGLGLGVVLCKASTKFGRCGTSAIGAKKRMPLPSLLSPEVESSNLAFSSASAVAFLVKVEFDSVYFLFIINC